MPDPNLTAQLHTALAPLNLPPAQIAAIAEVLRDLVAGNATSEAAQTRVQSVFGSGNEFAGAINIAGDAAGGHIVKIGTLNLSLAAPDSRSAAITRLEAEIADLTRALGQVAAIPAAFASVQATLHAKQQELAALRGGVVGVNQGTITTHGEPRTSEG